jgi:fructose-1,6-bisphosphatase/inositol monophosphatase family enzyme
MPHDIQHAMRVAQAAALDVGPYLLEGFRADTQVRLKGPIDLVTEYDIEAERRLREALSSALPYRIVGEEAGASGDASGGAVWYVDPIDGTTNFAHGHPFFCISLGLFSEEARGWWASCTRRRWVSPGWVVGATASPATAWPCVCPRGTRWTPRCAPRASPMTAARTTTTTCARWGPC